MTDYHVDPNVMLEMALLSEEARRLLDLPDVRTGDAWRAAVALLDGSAGEDGRRRVAAALEGTDHVLSCGIDQLLRARGIDPDAAMVLASLSGDGRLMILDGDSPDRARGDRPIARVAIFGARRASYGGSWFSPGHGLIWTDDHLRAPRAPETLMTSRVGRPLSDWISHPLLDRLRTMVVDHRPCPDDAHLVYIVTDLHVRKDGIDD
jgi:hypothetical protein